MMNLDHIELNRLSISPANMRAKRAPDLGNILPSVRERGILVPLIVRPAGEEGRFEVVAGRRRLLSAQKVAEEKGEYPPLPCAIMEEGDDVAALEASLIENVARLDPDEVTQWETFSRLVREGRSVDEIAATFGVTERMVQRVLALGNLNPRIRKLYRQELIDAGIMRHLTMATKAQQREWLALYDSTDAYAPTGQHLKQWLLGGETIPTSVALFDWAVYPAPIVSDLFGEESYFSDPEAFWRLQREAVEAKRQEYLEDGWSGVEIFEPGDHFQRWKCEKRSKAKGGQVYIALSYRGDVEFHEGWLPRKEAHRQEAGEEAPQAKAERPELTSALRNYLNLHRHAAVRTRLLEGPGMALRLLIAHAILGSALWDVKPEPQRADKPAIAESLDASMAEMLFGEKRQAVLALLGLEVEARTLVRGGHDIGKIELFHRLVKLSDEQVLEVAAVVMSETLEARGELLDFLTVLLAVEIGDFWQADEVFFDLIRDKKVLVAMVAEVAGPEAASANQGETGKVLKTIIRHCLAGENGRTKVKGWVPKWLQFPTGSYRQLLEAERETAEAPEALPEAAE